MDGMDLDTTLWLALVIIAVMHLHLSRKARREMGEFLHRVPAACGAAYLAGRRGVPVQEMDALVCAVLEGRAA